MSRTARRSAGGASGASSPRLPTRDATRTPAAGRTSSSSPSERPSPERTRSAAPPPSRTTTETCPPPGPGPVADAIAVSDGGGDGGSPGGAYVISTDAPNSMSASASRTASAMGSRHGAVTAGSTSLVGADAASQRLPPRRRCDRCRGRRGGLPCHARHGPRLERQALAVVADLQRLSLAQLVARLAGKDLHAKATSAVEEVEAQPGEA